MSQTVTDLLARLTLDPWRESKAFSNDIADANKRMFEAGDASDEICAVLREWLGKYQPCVFGKIAARQNLIGYCILTEQDLSQSDDKIHDKIQEAHLKWTREGFAGKKSGFVLLATSPKLAYAVPDQHLKSLAQKLCSLYLPQEIKSDRILLDEIFLEKPGEERMTWKWLAGVNYFCANGDGRWWQDHRIPGGMAFSVNSVGHLVKTGAIAQELMSAENKSLVSPDESFVGTKIDSLDQALIFAMRTIGKASCAVSGKATDLLALSDNDLPAPKCPFELPADLAGKDFRYYRGYYNTDFTIPSEYFLPDITRPSHCKAQTLEFTYLFDSDLNNPDYETMGAGRRIRGTSRKASRIKPTSELIEANERLVRALRGK